MKRPTAKKAKRPRTLFTPPPPDAVLTKDDVARWLQLHPRSVQRLVHEKGLPALNLTTRNLRFLASQVRDWLLKQGKSEGEDLTL